MRPDFGLAVLVSTAQDSGISKSSYSWEWREGKIRLPKTRPSRRIAESAHNAQPGGRRFFLEGKRASTVGQSHHLHCHPKAIMKRV
jgi:hypothetical protein